VPRCLASMQANSASYPARDEKSVPAKVRRCSAAGELKLDGSFHVDKYIKANMCVCLSVFMFLAHAHNFSGFGPNLAHVASLYHPDGHEEALWRGAMRRTERRSREQMQRDRATPPNALADGFRTASVWNTVLGGR